MLFHNSKAYINHAIQFRKIYHSTRNSIHSSLKFHQTIHSFYQQIYSGKLISPLFSKATQTTKSSLLFIEGQAMKKEIDTRILQERNGHRFLQFIFLFMFSYTRDLITKVEEGKENKACHFLFLSYLGGRFIFTSSNL